MSRDLYVICDGCIGEILRNNYLSYHSASMPKNPVHHIARAANLKEVSTAARSEIAIPSKQAPESDDYDQLYWEADADKHQLKISQATDINTSLKWNREAEDGRSNICRGQSSILNKSLCIQYYIS